MKLGLKILVGAVVLAAMLWAVFFVDVRESLTQGMEWVSGLGVWGPVVFVLIYAISAILMLPGSVMTLGAGILFGLTQGIIIILIGATLGATIAFLVSRYLARDWVAEKIAGKEKYCAMDQAVGDEGWKIVLLTRLSPMFPFNVLNYAYGVTRVSLRDYFFASILGMLPGTVFYVYIGSMAGSLAMVGEELRQRSLAEWIFYAIGFVVAVVVTIYVTRLARKALREKHVST
jgi:uncharacterized membrane protein YdjX (TVP38/TMEM64 family)